MYRTFISGSSLRDIELSGAAGCCREKRCPDASLPVAEPWKAASRQPVLLPAPQSSSSTCCRKCSWEQVALQSFGHLVRAKPGHWVSPSWTGPFPIPVPVAVFSTWWQNSIFFFFYYAVGKFEGSVSFFFYK